MMADNIIFIRYLFNACFPALSHSWRGFGTDPLLSVLDCRFKHAFFEASALLPTFCCFHEPSHCLSRFSLALSVIFRTHLVEGRFVSMVQVVLDEGEKLRTKFYHDSCVLHECHFNFITASPTLRISRWHIFHFFVLRYFVVYPYC